MHKSNSSSVSSVDFPLPPSHNISPVSASSFSSSLTSSSCFTRRHSRTSSQSSIESLASSISSLNIYSPQFATYGAHLPDPGVKLSIPELVVDGGSEPLVVDEGPFPPTPRDAQFVPIYCKSQLVSLAKQKPKIKSFITNQPLVLSNPPTTYRRRSHSEGFTPIPEESFNSRELCNDAYIPRSGEYHINTAQEYAKRFWGNGNSPTRSTFTLPQQNRNYTSEPENEAKDSYESEKRLCSETRALLLRGRQRALVKRSKSFDASLQGHDFNFNDSNPYQVEVDDSLIGNRKRRWWT